MSCYLIEVGSVALGDVGCNTGNLLLRLRPNISTAGACPVTEWGVFLYANNQSSSAKRQFYPSAIAVFTTLLMFLLSRSTSAVCLGVERGNLSMFDAVFHH